MNQPSLLQITSLLADTTWRPGFGARWIWWIAAIQLIASGVCYAAARVEKGRADGKHLSALPNFWTVLAIFMLALCINKVFDLQSLLTMFLRTTSQQDGWHARRKSLQAAFVFGSAVVGILGLIASFYILRGHWRQRGLASLAAVFLLTLVVVRLASYNRVDAILYGLPGIGNRMNAGLELGASFLVGIGAFLAGRSIRRLGPDRESTQVFAATEAKKDPHG